METSKFRKYSERTTDCILGFFRMYLEFLTEQPPSKQWDKFEKLVAVAATIKIPDEPSLSHQLHHYAIELVGSFESKDVATVVISAIRFGHFIDCLLRSKDGEDIYFGERHRINVNQSYKVRFGDGSALKRRNKDMQSMLAQLMATLDLTHASACEEVANKYRVSERTVRRNTVNPNAKRKN